jgi:hypothetical protein
MSAAFVLITLISQTAFAQEPVAWEKEAAQKEIDGMRRYAWALSGKIGDSLKKAPVEDFPAVHAFLRDFHDARKAVDPEQAPSEWKTIDVEAVAIRNPNYWAAVYEAAPADPLMMWFHASLHAVNGQVAPTLYSQLLAAHSPVNTPQKEEMSRLIVSSSRLIMMGEKAVGVGVKLHDQEEYDKSAKVFRDVLSVIPSHSLALYELGNTLKRKDGGAAAQSQFDQAKRVDPFRTEAYQGSFSFDEIQRLSLLRSEAKPAWDKFMQTPPKQDTVEQLERLSSQLQAAGIHELGLLVRQLVAAHRENSHNEDDLQFIKVSLQSLMPEEDFEAVLKGLASK